MGEEGTLLTLLRVCARLWDESADTIYLMYTSQRGKNQVEHRYHGCATQ